jgi:hypothetical protein
MTFKVIMQLISLMEGAEDEKAGKMNPEEISHVLDLHVKFAKSKEPSYGDLEFQPQEYNKGGYI